jgi:hypothetical protein
MRESLLCIMAALSFLPRAAQAQLGTVHFQTSCSPAAQPQFDRAVALLHSFFYPETEKAFRVVIATDSNCAMAYWGLGMSARPNPLVPVSMAALKKGRDAVAHAQTMPVGTQREKDWIAALNAYYHNLETDDFNTRVTAYERAMQQLYRRYPEDREAAVFYALALNEATDHGDKTYARQLEAGTILERVLAVEPDHPGVTHYIIHSYDYPPLATRGLSAAERYATIAPDAPHALHMPSHIFSMLGMWSESIRANIASEAAAKKYAAANLPGQTTWLHMQDFRIYAELQEARDQDAQRLVAERNALPRPLAPLALSTATAYAAIPVRFVLERGRWSEAADIPSPETGFAQADAMIFFGKGIAAARLGHSADASVQVQQLQTLRDSLRSLKDAYWGDQVEIQRLAVSAWMAKGAGRNQDGVTNMRAAADLEDASEKHIAMENRLIPMRELLGELLLEAHQPADALREFEASLTRAPNRFRSFFGAARAAEAAGDGAKARTYYSKLTALVGDRGGDRPEVATATAFLSK